MTTLRPETEFELQSNLLPADSLYDITKKYQIILILISALGYLKILVAYHIYCQALIPVIITAYNY